MTDDEIRPAFDLLRPGEETEARGTPICIVDERLYRLTHALGDREVLVGVLNATGRTITDEEALTRLAHGLAALLMTRVDPTKISAMQVASTAARLLGEQIHEAHRQKAEAMAKRGRPM